ncbi:CotO family spore coat protein [Neobacillus novalis]|uniref:CotO family spore coat protein n=1 Tax=Neobacillus novalis TaxID=220687 RepID=A0AA95MPC4_9BACI|nr:CotO family spore coat protein [Neobacillus novalis]WHY87784.1 CotO family spore coat protein [Neobacillus novalis]
MSNKKSHRPRLYVDQSFSRGPSNSNMQEVYTNKREQEQGGDTRRKISLAKKELIEPIPIEPYNSEDSQPASTTQHHERHKSSFKRVKPFKDMNLNERLDYLINFPKVLPPVPCVFYTAEKNYQGYLKEYTGSQVTIQFHDQTSKAFPLDELKDIIMIGIKK